MYLSVSFPLLSAEHRKRRNECASIAQVREPLSEGTQVPEFGEAPAIGGGAHVTELRAQQRAEGNDYGQNHLIFYFPVLLIFDSNN